MLRYEVFERDAFLSILPLKTAAHTAPANADIASGTATLGA